MSSDTLDRDDRHPDGEAVEPDSLSTVSVESEVAQSKVVPEPTLRRLPRYVHFLKALRLKGRSVVSTSHIAADLKLDPTQVRKDLAYTGIVGKPKVGYEVDALIACIEEFLGWNNTTEAFLVGAGSLGAALMGHKRLEEYGLKIVAAFDSDRRKVGESIHEVEVLGMEKLVGLAERMHIHIGIITVPAEGAQAVADMMMEGGIRAIWNFAPAHIDAPEGVVVVNGELYSTLGLLKRGLSQVLKADA